MKYLLISFIWLIFSLATYSQTNVMTYFKLENQYILKGTLLNPQNSLVKYFDNSIYTIKRHLKEVEVKDTIKIYKKNTQEEKLYKLFLKQKDWINDFTVFENKFVFLGQYFIHIYRIVGKDIVFDKVVSTLGKWFDVIESGAEGKVILWSSCWSCYNRGMRIAIFDLSQEKFVIEKTLPDPLGFPLATFQPRRIVSHYGKQFAVADITEYSIKIYDDNFDLQFNITRKPEKWAQQADLYKELEATKRVNDIFNESSKFEKINYKNSSIHLIDFLDDSTLFVCWSTDNMNNSDSTGMPLKFLYDIWKKNDKGKWYLHKKDLVNVFFHKSEKFHFDEFNKLLTNYTVSNGKLILSSVFPFLLNSFDLQSITFKELWEQQEKYIKQNGLEAISFFVYKYVK